MAAQSDEEEEEEEEEERKIWIKEEKKRKGSGRERINDDEEDATVVGASSSFYLPSRRVAMEDSSSALFTLFSPVVIVLTIARVHSLSLSLFLPPSPSLPPSVSLCLSVSLLFPSSNYYWGRLFIDCNIRCSPSLEIVNRLWIINLALARKLPLNPFKSLNVCVCAFLQFLVPLLNQQRSDHQWGKITIVRSLRKKGSKNQREKEREREDGSSTGLIWQRGLWKTKWSGTELSIACNYQCNASYFYCLFGFVFFCSLF